MKRQQSEQGAHEAQLARLQLQTFLGLVAHELSTPVTGTLGRAQLALRMARPSRQRHALVTIEAEARDPTRLIADLRDASQAGSGRFDPSP